MRHCFIRQIIREQFKSLFSENIFAKPSVKAQEPTTDVNTGNDQVFYNFSKGKNFAFIMLQDKITNLEKYNLSDYFPISETAERWMFEAHSRTDKTLLVEIKHKIKENKSIWYFVFATMQPGEQMPVIEFSSGAIYNYQNFVDKINQQAANLIDPNDK